MKLITSKEKDSKINSSFKLGFRSDKFGLLSSMTREEARLFVKRSIRVEKLSLMKSPDGLNDALVYTFRNNGKLETKIKVLERTRDKDEFENDAKIFSSIEILLAKSDIRKINLAEFLESIKGYFGADVRYAYKKFNVSGTKNVRHSVYIYHIYGLIIATSSLINELDFKPPIYISLRASGKRLKLSFKSSSGHFAGLSNRLRLLNTQGVETRLEYIGAVCREDDISSTLKITDNKLEIEYEFDSLEKEGALYADVTEDNLFFREYMDIFNPVRHIEGEEAEEE